MNLMIGARQYFQHSCRNPKRLHIEDRVRQLVERGIGIYEVEGCDSSLDMVVVEAMRRKQEHDARGRETWKQWAADSFLQGAKQAHRFVKGKHIQDILPAEAGTQPSELADHAFFVLILLLLLLFPQTKASA